MTYALASLFCFGMARLPTRVDSSGNFSMFEDQDRSKWDQALIAEGMTLLSHSASGCELSEYHIEAAIASIHTTTGSFKETDWDRIVSLYDSLVARHPSPIAELNRTIAIAQKDGPRRGLDVLNAIADRARLANYPFYAAALGECESRLGNREAARAHYAVALELARNAAERRFLERRIDACGD